jgi:4-amino-4-deoxy-L-arabinose transferase-like glycosyltransferase
MRVRCFTSRPALWIALLATALVLVDLGRRILATNDEARFALLGQDMLTEGAWFFPHLNGTVYHAKPLLQAWLIALCSWPVGHVTQLTAVLPSALAGIGTVLVVFAIGRSMFGADAGRFAALVAMTTQGWFLHARLPMPDMLLTLFATSSLMMFWRMLRARPGPNWFVFYGLVALGFWAKGAAGLMPLAAAVVHAIATRQLTWGRPLYLAPGLGLVTVSISPWWVRQWFADAAALREVVLTDNLGWYVPSSVTVALLSGPFQHVVGILFPWVLVVPAVMWQAVRFLRGRGVERDAVHVLILWSVALLGCVAVSEQQRLRYYVPLVPPVALLVGWWCAGAIVKRRVIAHVPWRIYGIAAGMVALATLVAVHFRPTWANPSRLAWPSSMIEAAVMAGGLVVMVGALAYGMSRNALGRTFALAWLGSALWVGGWYHWELERRNAAYDYPRVHAEAQRLVPEAPVVATWGVYELPFSFYFDRRVVPVATDDDLRRVMAQHPKSSAVLTIAALAQLEERQRFRVVPLDRLNFDSIVLVTNALDAPPAAVKSKSSD